jgi:hypothetical protein
VTVTKCDYFPYACKEPEDMSCTPTGICSFHSAPYDVAAPNDYVIFTLVPAPGSCPLAPIQLEFGTSICTSSP